MNGLGMRSNRFMTVHQSWFIALHYEMLDLFLAAYLNPHPYTLQIVYSNWLYNTTASSHVRRCLVCMPMLPLIWSKKRSITAREIATPPPCLLRITIVNVSIHVHTKKKLVYLYSNLVIILQMDPFLYFPCYTCPIQTSVCWRCQ